MKRFAGDFGAHTFGLVARARKTLRNKTMRIRFCRLNTMLGLISLVLLGTSLGWAQLESQEKLKTWLAEVKESITQSQKSLQQYSWVETTEISLKGEIKSRKQNDCHYGPDGTVQKTPTSAPQEQKKKRGLKGKIVEKKKEELADYMERAASLVHRYVPPDPSKMQAAMQAGKGTVQLAPAGKVELIFRDYAKSGDEFALTFDGPGKRIRGVNVRSYLDEPGDAVGLTLIFSKLADGTNYLSESLLDAPAKKVQVKTTNFGHQKSGS